MKKIENMRKLLELQKQYELGLIKEENLTIEERENLIKLYKEQINTLKINIHEYKQELNHYKNKIIEIKKQSKK